MKALLMLMVFAVSAGGAIPNGEDCFTERKMAGLRRASVRRHYLAADPGGLANEADRDRVRRYIQGTCIYMEAGWDHREGMTKAIEDGEGLMADGIAPPAVYLAVAYMKYIRSSDQASLAALEDAYRRLAAQDNPSSRTTCSAKRLNRTACRGTVCPMGEEATARHGCQVLS